MYGSALAPRLFHPSSIFHLKHCVFNHILTLLICLSLIPFEVLFLAIELYFLFLLIINYPIRKKNSSYQLSLYQDYQKRTKITQVINSQLVKTIKREQTFEKLSILTKSTISKLGGIIFSLVQFHLVHFSVKVPTRLWSKSSCCLIDTKILCIDFIDIVALIGQ